MYIHSGNGFEKYTGHVDDEFSDDEVTEFMQDLVLEEEASGNMTEEGRKLLEIMRKKDKKPERDPN